MESIGYHNCARNLYRKQGLPRESAEGIDECLDEVPIEVNRDLIRSFILNGQERIRKIIWDDELWSGNEGARTDWLL